MVKNKRTNETTIHKCQLVLYIHNLFASLLSASLLSASLLSASCLDRPAYVLTEKKIEDILFDLYLLEQAIKENPRLFYNSSVQKRKLLLLVFDKHHISEQHFDTSLVWYSTRLDRYVEINKKVSKRYTQLIEQLRAKTIRTTGYSSCLTFKDMDLKDFVTSVLFLSFEKDSTIAISYQ